MTPTLVVPGLYQFTLGQVNMHLLDVGEDLVLIDTGYPGSGEAIVAAIRAIGRAPAGV